MDTEKQRQRRRNDTEKQRQRRRNDTEKQRQRRRNDMRLTESGNTRCEQLLAGPSAYRVANQQRMAARRALEWIRALKPGWFLDMKYQTCYILLKFDSIAIVISPLYVSL